MEVNAPVELPTLIPDNDEEFQREAQALKQRLLEKRQLQVLCENSRKSQEAKHTTSYGQRLIHAKHLLWCQWDNGDSLLEFAVPTEPESGDKPLTGNEALAQLSPYIRMVNEFVANNPVRSELLPGVAYEVCVSIEAPDDFDVASVIESKTHEDFYIWHGDC